MSGTVLEFLNEWWVRLFGWATPGRESAVSAIEPSAGTAPPFVLMYESAAKEAASEASESSLESSFIEMVGAPSAASAPRLNPKARESTLASLGALRQIPALQSLVQGVTQVMGRDGVEVADIVTALEKDSSLCVRILGMANSVAISPEQRIVDLDAAIQMLGFMRVRRTAQAVLTLRGSQRMADGIDWRHLWVHAFATAAIAEELDRQIRGEPSQQIYMAGLLHDIGKIALSTISGDDYREVIVASWNGNGRLEDLERAYLGVDHREAGAIFARNQKLSEAVTEVIAHHDDPSAAESHKSEAALVSIANYVSKSRGMGFSGSRLDASDGEFDALAAWDVLSEQTGRELRPAAVETELEGFLKGLRAELKELREAYQS